MNRRVSDSIPTQATRIKAPLFVASGAWFSPRGLDYKFGQTRARKTDGNKCADVGKALFENVSTDGSGQFGVNFIQKNSQNQLFWGYKGGKNVDTKE